MLSSIDMHLANTGAISMGVSVDWSKQMYGWPRETDRQNQMSQQNVSPQWKTRKLFMFKNLAFILLIAALSACAFNSGERSGNLKLENASQESLASQFKPDIATRDDVVSQLGPPDKKITAGSLEVWTYSYASNAYVMVAFAAVPTGAKKVANFYFDDKTGVLKKVELDMHRG